MESQIVDMCVSVTEVPEIEAFKPFSKSKPHPLALRKNC